jgi:hypothetical protein
MEYGLTVSKKELDILNRKNIEYYFWDGYDLFDDDSEQMKNDKIEITFDNKNDRDIAAKILRR